LISADTRVLIEHKNRFDEGLLFAPHFKYRNRIIEKKKFDGLKAVAKNARHYG